MLTRRQRCIKRLLDVLTAVLVLALLGWVIAVMAYAARRSTGAAGLFRQTRVGQGGQPFEIFKLRTMRSIGLGGTTVTVAGDDRVTRLGAFLRRTKLDELPQLINVLRGEMSLVGPRPDVIEFVDLNSPQMQLILSVRPGITGPASLAFRDEEGLLAQQQDPEQFNVEYLVPAKARINEHYVRTWRLTRDLRYLVLTLSGGSLTEAEALA